MEQAGLQNPLPIIVNTLPDGDSIKLNNAVGQDKKC